MKLDYSYNEIASILSSDNVPHSGHIYSVAFDTRRIINGEYILFFALEGFFRNGHEFISAAYQKGVRHFVVSESGTTSNLKGTYEIVVPDTLIALEKIAQHHRSRFSIPIVAITGSNGKTTVKEWLSHLLSGEKNITRSPKSYNSRLGIALSLLELTDKTDVGIIEVGIGEKGSMKKRMAIIQPTHGIFTVFGKTHRELFDSKEDHLLEKLELFKNVAQFFYLENETCLNVENAIPISPSSYATLLEKFQLKDNVSQQNVSLAIAMSLELGLSLDMISKRITDLSPLALRMESFDGVNGNTIINDTYSLDFDSLRHSLAYQLANCNNKKRIAIIGLHEKNNQTEKEIQSIVSEFEPIELHIHYLGDSSNFNFSNSSILIKGSRQSKMEILAQKMKHQNHQTYLEINLKSIRHNINYYKSKLDDSTKLLCMVKASSYGSDAKTMGLFLEQMGIDYLGVAYVNEGVELRSKGVKISILVMNCEEQSFSECIENDLEPAIYSLKHLNAFMTELIGLSRLNYPVHLKVETGMNRLGFDEKEIPELISILNGQPEVNVQSIYSHLAESDVQNSDFTKLQISNFSKIASEIQAAISYPIIKHLLNSDGIINYPEAQFDMARIGIGMYGVMENPNLRQAISWYSSISQIKQVTKGESVGYGRSFFADKDVTIAIIPIGYADGLRRNLGHKKGGIFLGKTYCPIIGNVCMDMIMIDVTATNAKDGDLIEIIGENQTVRSLAEKLETIPYEIMTSFSSRVHRVYVDQ